MDSLVAVGLVAMVLLGQYGSTPWWVLGIALVLLVGSIGLARRWPWASLTASVVLTIWSPNLAVAAGLVAFRIGRWGLRPPPFAVGMGGVLAVGALTLPWLTARVSLEQLGTVPMVVVAAWATGTYLYRRDELERRARAGIAARVRSRERARIAQDMHDSLGHEIGLIAVRAGVLELSPHGGPQEVRDSARSLRLGAARAAERLRQVVGVLHANDTEGDGATASTRPHPTEEPENVDGLVGRAREAGMTVHLEVRGGPREVPETVRRSVDRVVREALTNAAKHAPGAPVEVRVTHADEETVIAVANPVAGDGDVRGPEAGHGTGLVGLRERVRLTHGTFSAAVTDEGFTVHVRLPHAVPTHTLPETPSDTAVPLHPDLVGRERGRVRGELVRLTVATAAVCVALTSVAALYGW
ncbi:hypothetical protein J4H86_07045 [Spiractinospora alimapuensis]|uniref:histidine kinase n=1 Tax=Spiractinospora alimapuensis TaxID=2820884 RepID=UPI001F42901D|nr:histidine kinase [Spiractinospora alimapuensis]QVQ53500.1 hypothetical protein J4H86_07045 [Spiractinospora alimapuensis]